MSEPIGTYTARVFTRLDVNHSGRVSLGSLGEPADPLSARTKRWIVRNEHLSLYDITGGADRLALSRAIAHDVDRNHDQQVSWFEGLVAFIRFGLR